MTWLTWRQFRVQVAVAAGALVVVAVILLVSGLHIHNVYDAFVSQCRPAGNCGSAFDPVSTIDRPLQITMAAIVMIVPALVGIFWGAPLLARELETGTYRLAFTQSVSRARWVATKVGIGAGATAVVVGLLSLVDNWWYSPIADAKQNQFQLAIFSLRGIVPIGYAVFAFALGMTIGVLLRRTLAAMAVTIPLFIAARLVVTYWVRPNLIPPVQRNYPLTANNLAVSLTPTGVVAGANPPGVANGWVYSGRLVDAAGRAPTAAFFRRVCSQLSAVSPSSGRISIKGGPGPSPSKIQNAFRSCAHNIVASGRFHEVAVYQPASRYWPMQGLEFGVFVVGAALLALGSLWWVRHRVL